MDECQHNYQFETVGGVYLTGAYVCRLCSFRIGMSHEQFHRHATYPGQYQADISREATIESRASQARVRYSQRLEEQLQELISENLPCQLSQQEHDEILTEVIEEALRALVKACTEVATHCGLSEGTAVADIIERTIGERTRERRPAVENEPELPLPNEQTTWDRSCHYPSRKDRN